jgi:cysteine-rich repeat protein
MRWTVVLALFACVGCKASNKHPDAGVGGNGDDMGLNCGNGVIDPGEDCDDGANNGTVGDRCNQFCNWTCIADAKCDDGNVCNGAETCVDHVCAAGTPPSDGTTCGSGMLCRGGTCVASRCGDGIVTTPEECDDGNVTNGDGCDNNCKFSCKSTDTTRNCTPADVCKGQGTCNDTTHICAPGTPLGDGTSCPGGANNYCKAGTCTTPMCGNGVVEPGEQCDDGGLNGTLHDGCTTMCKFVCVNPVTDCGTAPVCEKWSCTTAHTCMAIADATQNGNACGTPNLICKDGACIAPTAVCGNGVVETGEDCDFGTGNGPNTGCESNCKFSCANAAACDDGNPCNGVETCDSVTVMSHMGQKCNPGTAPVDGTVCGTGKICLHMICNTSTCGDGFVDHGAGETCDPPNIPAGCDSHCHIIKCGDGQRQDTEQCDDGNTTNLDGCDDHCKFEQDQRANSLVISYDTTVCNPNALGGAIIDTTTAQPSLQKTLSDGVKAGSINILIKLLGLDDLTGTHTTLPFRLGFLHATPTSTSGYDGTNDVDWWYASDLMSLDPMRNPTTQLMNGKFAAGTLTADKGTLTLTVNLGGSAATLTMYNANVTARSDQAATTPKSSTGATPGHLASENLDPALQSFQVLSGGKLCGDVSAGSLAQVTMPMSLQGALTCTLGFGATNHLLDAIVGGCYNILIGPVIKGTQPDGSTDGNHYTFTMTGNKVTGCTGGAAWPTCLDKATYSSAFQFTTDRVICK